MMKRIQLAWTLLGLGLIALGVVLGWQPLIQTLHRPQSASVLSQPLVAPTPQLTAPPQQSLIQGHPVRIQLPSLGINLAVIDGYYNSVNQTWTLTKDKAQFATITTNPNNHEGNTFIYGHNRAQVFQNLYKIQQGQQAIVNTDNGHTFVYAYTGSQVTNPNDSSLFKYQGAPILTLQTCSGLWYQNRQLFHFSFVSVS